MELIDIIIKIVRELGFSGIALYLAFRLATGFLKFLTENNGILKQAITDTNAMLKEIAGHIAISNSQAVAINRSLEQSTAVYAAVSDRLKLTGDNLAVVDTKIGTVIKYQEELYPLQKAAIDNINTLLPQLTPHVNAQIEVLAKVIEAAKEEISQSVKDSADDTKTRLAAEIVDNIAPVMELIRQSQDRLEQLSNVSSAISSGVQSMHKQSQELSEQLNEAVKTLTTTIVGTLTNLVDKPPLAISDGQK